MEMEVYILKILLHGCNGKMGQVITRLAGESQEPNAAFEIVCGVDLDFSRIKNSYPVYSSFDEVLDKLPVEKTPDVIIDFSHHSCIENLLRFATSQHIPLVICTTGFTPYEVDAISKASEQIPILMSANMSLGVNLLISLVTKASTVLGDSFDIEIVEKHHNQKHDAPSGTALMIADAINQSLGGDMRYVYGRSPSSGTRSHDEIGIHSVRGGAIVGVHDVIFAGQGEVIEISHTAISRDVFGYGALSAAQFLIGKGPGLYSMQDVIDGVS
jgi:4-hydroxy-tetrahydrodipicolinate reductase